MRSDLFRLPLLLLAIVPCGYGDIENCEYDFHREEVQQTLLDSSNVSALLMGSAMSDRVYPESYGLKSLPVPSSEFLQRAGEIDSDNERYLQRLTRHCGAKEHRAEKLCSTDPAARLTELYPENGHNWFYLAQTQYESGDTEAALESLQVAANKDRFSLDWGAQLREYSEATAALFPRSEACAVEFAAGIAATDIPSYAPVFETCRANVTDGRWARACVRLGEAMEHKGRAMITVNLGNALQRSVYDALGDHRQVEIVAARKEELQRLSESYADFESCLIEDSESREAWLDRVETLGEIGAMRDTVERGGC